MDDTIHAAGGVVWKKLLNNSLVVLCIHRARYGDWCLPKGKRDEGETDEACALREVHEETGLVCELGRELTTLSRFVVDWRDGLRKPKSCRFWLMQSVDADAEPDPLDTAEVDEWRWISLLEALQILSYDDEKTVIAEAHRVLV